MRLRSLACRPGCDLDVASLWALIQTYRQNQVFGSATLTDIGQRLRVPHEVLGPTCHSLVARGFALQAGGQARSDPGRVTDGRLWLTPSGLKQVDAASAAIVGRIVDKLSHSPSFDGHSDREQVEAALERIAHRMLVQRGWQAEPEN